MRYGSICSGIEAATVAWHSLRWKPQWFAEVEPFPSAVLNHHWPDVPNLGDITSENFINDTTGTDPIDLLVGGTPCQAFSAAGNRNGFDDERGNLTLRFLELVGKIRPTWLVWENVPGVLSIDGGRTFGTILEKMAEHGYGWAYRVLDAQWFGVPQRRRRVFVVGHSSGEWQRSAEVLAVSQSMPGNPPTRQTSQEDVADSTGKGTDHSGVPELAATLLGSPRCPDTDGLRTDTASLVPYRMKAFGDYVEDETASTILERDHKDHKDLLVTFFANGNGDGKTVPTLVGDHAGHVSHYTPVVVGGENASTHPLTASSGGTEDGTGRGTPIVVDARQDPVTSTTGLPLGAKDTGHALVEKSQRVRRLTPVECERLQGFPDNHTQIPWRNKTSDECPDGPRYKAIGNSMAVPVMRWIGERINNQPVSKE